MAAIVPNYILLLFILIGSAFTSAPSFSDDWSTESISLRARYSEKTVLGNDAPENFKEYDLSVNFDLPWERYSSGWGAGSRLMTSVGLLDGVDNDALVVSLIPELTLGGEDGRFLFDIGVGGALFSRYRFGRQDFGGPFQFALTTGIRVPIYGGVGIGYRFLHYSDAGVNGPDTTGLDFHMIELSYQL